MKNCAPLWREADLEVKKLKTLHVLGTFGRCVEMLNKCTCCGAKHISKIFEVNMVKTPHVRTTFGS